ncbi:MAG: TonB-dependent receptor [Colwellia sp.]|nr:TonB-dependent receptor [Colwellia sp.]
MNTKLFKYSMVAAVVIGCMPLTSVMAADNSQGSIYGKNASGSTVTIKNVDTGLTRQITVNEDGKFTFKNLPVGKYTVMTTDGLQGFVRVNIGTGSNVNFVSDDIETISVTGSNIATIDTSTSESSVIFSAEDMELLPVGRNITDVAMLAPTTVQGDSAFGNLAAFGGSSVAENGYYLNGFNITNNRSLLSFANVPFSAIGSQQIKIGGYGAEYGRALGGIVNQVTKSGTNEWKFSTSINWMPDSLKAEGKDVLSLNPDDDTPTGSRYLKYRTANNTDRTQYEFSAGGPIIKDELFIFAAIQYDVNEYESYFKTSSRTVSRSAPQGLVKVDWYVTPEHVLEFTGVYNERKDDYSIYDNPYSDGAGSSRLSQTGKHGEKRYDYGSTNGGHIAILKYSGQIADDLSISAVVGDSYSIRAKRDPDVASDVTTCNRIWDSRSDKRALVHMGCWEEGTSSIIDPDVKENFDSRFGVKFDLEYVWGDHTIRAGYDTEDWENNQRGNVYVGTDEDRLYYRYFKQGSANHSATSVNGIELIPGQEYVRTWDGATLSATYKSTNTAYYIEDSWQMTDDLLIYGGLRWESFENLNGEGNAFVDAENELAPRFGFSWDVEGDSTKKLFASAGRFFVPVAGNTNEKLSGVSYRDVAYHNFDSIDPVTGVPHITGPIGTPNIESRKAPNPGSIVVTDLQPMYQDEIIIGYQQEAYENWTLGIKGIYRKLKNGMDDFCNAADIYGWALDAGYADINFNDIPGCIVLNPGKDLKMDLDLDHSGNLTAVTVPNSSIGLPKYQRDYKAVEFTFNRAFVDGWYVGGSYVWSKNQGNAEGYVNSSLDQDDAGITQDFDHRLYNENIYGDLPNHREHVFKLFGAYQINDELTVAINTSITSGRAVSCQGFVPRDEFKDLDNPSSPNHRTWERLGRYGDSAYYCRDENGEQIFSGKGAYGETPWTFNTNLNVTYKPEAIEGLRLFAMISNVFNSQKVTEKYEKGDISRDSGEQNPNFLLDSGYQTPRAMTIRMTYDF